MSRNNTKSILSSWLDSKFRLITEGILVGLLAGMIVVGYRFVLEWTLSWTKDMYAYQREHIWLIPVWVVVLIAGGLATGFMVKKQPVISGSGIPQVKGILQNKLSMNWWKVIIGKFAGGTVSIGAGLSLGREGPSIQIGAAVGQGFAKVFRMDKVRRHFLMTCGASAGLAAAFNAPIAGVIFALEELHNNFSPLVMISALASSLVADFVSKEFFGLQPVFNLKNVAMIPLNQYLSLILLGLLVGVMGMVFNYLLFKSQDLYQKMKRVPVQARPVLPFLLAGLFGLILPEVLGGGNDLVNSLLTDHFTVGFLLVILTAKLIFTMLSYGSSAPGGIFLPMLVAGALLGVLYAKLMTGVFGLDEMYLGSFMILAMAGYFTAIVKAPITGIILITEMTGSFSNLLPTGIVCFIAYIAAEAFRSKPIYEALLDRLLQKGSGGFRASPRTKLIMEMAVHAGSSMDGKMVKDMEWPPYCLIVGVKKGEKEIIPNGDTVIQAGDYLIVLTNEDAAPDVRECLSEAAAAVRVV